ncbi:MAG TPA: cytochrome c maturation protein CcmE [Acidobacteriaceae bacterium]|jgi:cytochrome c-type biogenesis protein CcmE|nr:cytochrome c maturation protein CcmE [Acidobacteriaceae bacterium]
MQSKSTTLRVAIAMVIILGTIGYLAVTGVRSNKSYYVTIQELQGMGNRAFTRHLRVAGNVQPGSIKQDGSHMRFTLVEQGRTLNVNYTGMEPPPDTFKDNAQALAVGFYGRDGVFHASQIQAKCASKYAAVPPKNTAETMAPTQKKAG